MRRWLTYCLLLIRATTCFSQKPPWGEITQTKESATFIFKKDFLEINGHSTSFEEGDAIGVFGYTGKIYECVGFTIIPNAIDSFLTVTAHKRDSLGTYGFQKTSPYKLFYWHKALNCQFEISRQNISDSVLRVSRYIIDSSKTNLSIVNYPKSTYFPSDRETQPTITPRPADLFITFLKTNGLEIDTTGRINLMASQASRTYKIQFESNYCLSNSAINLMTDSLIISINQDSIPQTKDTLNITHLTPIPIFPTCTKAGGLLIPQKDIIGTKPFFFQLTHQTSQRTYTSNTGNFDELPSGMYKLEVTDAIGNMSTYHSPITLLLTEDCTNNPVLTPDNRNGLQTLYISDAGIIKILDREGKTIRELPVPGEWDGTDNKGLPAQMGDYYLFLNGQQYKIVTIIR